MNDIIKKYDNLILELQKLSGKNNNEIDKLLDICYEYAKTTNNKTSDIIYYVYENLQMGINYNEIIDELKSGICKYEKPPLGLIPHKFWIDERIRNISEAIKRYIESDMQIPIEWIEEYNKLIGE